MVTIRMVKFQSATNLVYMAYQRGDAKNGFVATGPHENSLIYEITRDLAEYYKTGIKLDFDCTFSEVSLPWTIREEMRLQGELIMALSEVDSFPRPLK